MPTIIVTRGDDGRLCGMSLEDERQYRRFVNRARSLPGDESLVLSWKAPRSPVFHRRHFALLNRIFDNQEVFVVRRQFRKWGEVGAGHCDWVPGPAGVMVPVPKSIDYESLDDDEFRELHLGVRAFIQSPRGLSTLWPHANEIDAWHAVEAMAQGEQRE